MAKIDDFKNFVKDNPHLISYVKNDEMTWQKFYELYNLYGPDNEVWTEYKKERTTTTTNSTTTASSNAKKTSWNDLIDMAKNLDLDSLQNGVSSLQKALGLFSELFLSKDETKVNNYEPRPIYRRFDD